MSDLISRADAIEAVRGLSVLVDDDDFSYFEDALNALPSADRELANLKEGFESADAEQKSDAYKRGFDDCKRAYEIELARSAEAEWIPCSERLPEKGEVVLITNGKGNVRCGQYRSEHDVRDGMHYWWWKGKTVESVLAWMPLPKPYKGGDTE